MCAFQFSMILGKHIVGTCLGNMTACSEEGTAAWTHPKKARGKSYTFLAFILSGKRQSATPWMKALRSVAPCHANSLSQIPYHLTSPYLSCIVSDHRLQHYYSEHQLHFSSLIQSIYNNRQQLTALSRVIPLKTPPRHHGRIRGQLPGPERRPDYPDETATRQEIHPSASEAPWFKDSFFVHPGRGIWTALLHHLDRERYHQHTCRLYAAP